MGIKELISKTVQEGNVSNEEMVECIQLLSDFLGLKTPNEYAIQRGIKFQSVYKSNKTRIILGRKMVVDND